MLKRIATAAALAVVIITGSGCAKQIDQFGTVIQAVSTATVSEDAAIIARSAFNTAQAGATSYLRLPRCTGSNGPLCRDPAYTERIGAAVQAGRRARNELTALMKRNPGGAVPVATYDALTTVTAIIQELTAAYRAARG